MNAENFSSFLEDPSRLYQIPYQELKSLVVQYPYCQPLRILLLQKSQMEGHPDFERNLQAAATYLPDRTLLFFLIREFHALESGELLFELEEERLELKALAEILVERQPLEEPEVTPAPVPPPPKTTPPDPILDLFREEEEEAEEGEEEPEIPVAEPDPVIRVQTDEEPESEVEPEPEPEPEVEPEPLIPQVPKERPRPAAPQPKSAFSSWQNRYEQLRRLASLSSFEIPHVPVEKVKTELPNPQEMARKSVEEKEDIATETLAELLVRQGHTQKAIAMYEKLRLIFPEKSSFFAQKIENLKK
ncbi:MAG: hypothetical protein H6563_10115 [Lewinellaceae bacterium]|nr:hypothetical protein [Lewinellaceae bacterium]